MRVGDDDLPTTSTATTTRTSTRRRLALRPQDRDSCLLRSTCLGGHLDKRFRFELLCGHRSSYHRQRQRALPRFPREATHHDCALTWPCFPPLPSWSNYLAESGRASAVDGDSSSREGEVDASPSQPPPWGFPSPTGRQADRPRGGRMWDPTGIKPIRPTRASIREEGCQESLGATLATPAEYPRLGPCLDVEVTLNQTRRLSLKAGKDTQYAAIVALGGSGNRGSCRAEVLRTANGTVLEPCWCPAC